ncbi:hypothetical protein Ancab_039636 [Ancistrocladus abbreviatus]
MEFPPIPEAIVGLLGILLLYNLYNILRVNWRKDISAPEVPGAWPIIGHLHHFDNKLPTYRTLSNMADKYGPVFTVRLGMRRVLMVSSWEAVKECFTTNDKAFASRPSSCAGKYLGKNFANFALAPYGPYWRDIRKLTTVELLSSQRLEALQHVRLFEVDRLIKKLHIRCSTKNGVAAKVVMSEMLENLTLDIIWKMVVGERHGDTTDDNDKEAEKIRKTIKEFMHAMGLNVLSDLIPIPFLERLDPKIRLMKHIAKNMDSIIRSSINEHQQRGLVSGLGRKQGFIDVLLQVVEKSAPPSEYTRETIISATMEALIIAGADTTSVALTWALSLLLNHDHALRHVQEELDQKVGRDRWVQESDIVNLIYLQAVIKEILRLYPPGPITIPHEVIEDCHVSAYHIPKGTRLVVNIWKLHRDPRVWTTPDEFKPERFLMAEANFDVLGRHFEFIPFSSGRRSCPGITMALQVLHLTIARLLQGFNLSKPTDIPIDMTEGCSLTLCKAIPLEVVLFPRLHPKLYEEI